MYRTWALALLFCGTFTNTILGAEIEVDFQGSVTVFSPVFGLSSSLASHPKTISGTFYYNTASVATMTSLPCPGVGCGSYEQHRVGGFSATISSATESVALSADDYFVQVKNDFLSSGNLRDGISVIWRSGLTPSLEPMHVDSAPQSVGQLRLDLTGLATLFSNAQLPTALNWSDFSTWSPPGLFSNSVAIPKGQITLTSLTLHPATVTGDSNASLPEPSTEILLLMFMILKCGCCRRRDV